MILPYQSPQEHLWDTRCLLAMLMRRLLDDMPPSLLVDRPLLNQECDDHPADLAELIAARLNVSPDLPLRQLEQRWALTPLAVNIIQLLLATEIDSELLQACACLHNDPARRWLTPGLIWRLFNLDPAAPASRAPFAPTDPLMRHRIIHAPLHINNYPVPLVERPLKLDDRMVAFLLDQETIEASLVDSVTLIPPNTAAPNDLFPGEVQPQLVRLLSRWRKTAVPPIFLWGRSGSGKRVGAYYLAAALHRPLLSLDAAHLTRDVWFALRREADLRGALIYLADFDRLDQPAAWWARLGEGVIVSGEELPHALLIPPPFTIQFPIPDYEHRLFWWKQTLNGRGDMIDITDLANQFRLTPGQIDHAVQMAQQEAWIQQGPAASPTRDNLFAGARGQSNPALSRLAMHVRPVYEWDDLVLPPAQLAQLRAIVSQARYTGQVYDSWGFANKLPYGRGLAALFSGPSGTGKTMSASILARTLGLDLYKINLAGVVSKYIGETEKNLDHIFTEAHNANVILFFDEADALFGKRSEVKDAHDRYANIEISYLLQKMEEYEGVSVLATNFSQNLDEAFTRRMQFVIDFPLPTAADRERIWRNLFPPDAPLADDIDFVFLAESFELTGGHIKNCVMTAAFAAASRQETINMAHLVRAVAVEFNKLNRPLQRAAFGDYFELARRYVQP
ncbi:MAG: ATP-binding protein [Chloroflexi bacterium]|nr:ATP-binding protein [Chloroflexota bacterium]